VAQKYRKQFIIDNFKWKCMKINCMPDMFFLFTCVSAFWIIYTTSANVLFHAVRENFSRGSAVKCWRHAELNYGSETVRMSIVRIDHSRSIATPSSLTKRLNTLVLRWWQMQYLSDQTYQ